MSEKRKKLVHVRQESFLEAMGSQENITELEGDIWFGLIRGMDRKTCSASEVLGGEWNSVTSQITQL